ncbi:hypothetical protein SELR_02380 [Selenomonas ruminantium subsp. lactilytica TAM6421]|uniref:Uncharacterized protein n=1 Tax=Selenomonas ruminantium subsp. lactilytica (strain NBRC 103574 / TAM6421) TaxID=927704 RepID=I0GMF9_SELRL|nr:hypothetical protein [Selenomonas ruminantium]BAL81946.1 hypothetical protein SELR_02380 [Selenomonas ruminantium subsp. lactilytica TAM6421]
MSYVSGFMMGAAIGKSIRQALGGSSAPKMVGRGRALPMGRMKKVVVAAAPAVGFKLVSSLPGRRRYRAGKISPQLAALLEEQLAKLSYVKSVSVNAASGSILLTFDEADDAHIDQLAKWLDRKFFGGKALPGEGCQAKSVASEAHAGSITCSIRNTARAFSQWIKDHTCGWFDMSSLASLLFLLRGLRKMLLTGQYPSGSQMLWWAVTLMRGWRTV